MEHSRVATATWLDTYMATTGWRVANTKHSNGMEGEARRTSLGNSNIVMLKDGGAGMDGTAMTATRPGTTKVGAGMFRWTVMLMVRGGKLGLQEVLGQIGMRRQRSIETLLVGISILGRDLRQQTLVLDVMQMLDTWVDNLNEDAQDIVEGVIAGLNILVDDLMIEHIAAGMLTREARRGQGG